MAANRDFFELVRAIGESKSKQEEDRIVAEEILFLKKKIPEPGSKKRMKEFVVRSIYVEMLGQDASFAYIRAVELCASTNIHQKRAGYLAASLFLSPEHEFRFMLVNQIQRDMQSSNHLETCAALTAVCKIVTVDMIPAVLGEIVKLLKHDTDSVRKGAVCALHRLHQMDKDCLQDHLDKIRRVLCDKEPSVMGASLSLLLDLITEDPSAYKDLVPSFVSILKQITEHRLPRDFDYHRIPAPWIQMDLLRILAVLGRGDQAASEGMYEVLVDVMRRADTGINVGYAVVYEAVRTVTIIYPNTVLLDAAATAISRFIRSESHNLKYIGIKGLAAIVNDYPRYAADHQMAVIDCLEDPDETLKRKTLDLLFRMTNSVNVEFIVDKLLSSLASASDDHFRADLVNRITQCAERFAPGNSWYVHTMIRVFELAGDKVKASVAQTLMQLIADGAEEDDEGEDRNIRVEAVENFLVLLRRQKLPDVLAQTMAWVLGEYGYLSTSSSKEQIVEELCNLSGQPFDAHTRAYIISAIMKLVAQNGSCPASAAKLANHYANSSSLEVSQRCLEFKALLRASAAMADALPVDASCEDVDVDPNLPMLTAYVQRALANGASPYSPPKHAALDADRDDESSAPAQSRLNYRPYERAAPPPNPANIIAAVAPTPGGAPSLAPAPGAAPNDPHVPTLLIAKNVNQVWGRKPEPPPPAAMPAAPAMPVHAAAPTPSFAAPVPAPHVVAPVAAPVPAAPREPTEKEKMAAALFGGMGGAGSKGGAPTRRASQSNQTPAAYAAPVQSAPVVAPTPTPVPAPAITNDNLLDMMDMGSPASAPPAPHAHTQPAAMSNMDLLSGLSSPPAPVHHAPPTPPAAPAASVFDVFDSVLSPAQAAAPLPGLGLATPTASALRPMAMPTSEFGARWGQTQGEAKQPVQCRLRALPQVRAALESVGLFHVESIVNTNESIFAASLASSPLGVAPVGTLLLAHVKFVPMRMECIVTVKSPSRDLCQEQLRSIGDALTRAS